MGNEFLKNLKIIENKVFGIHLKPEKYKGAEVLEDLRLSFLF